MSKTKDLIKEAVHIQQTQGNSSLDALKKYEEAINAFAKDDDEYELLYAHYQIMWIYCNNNRLGEAFPYAEKCLEMLDKTIRTGAVMHFTEMGKFHEEVIRFATNTVAWYKYVNTDDVSELENALELISLGCEYVDDPDYFYVFDTKVRILLKLGRKDEAFRIVYDCLKKEPDFSDFDDMMSNKEYREWKEDFESGNIEFTDKEIAFLEKAARINQKLKSQQTENTTTFEELMPEMEFQSIEKLGEEICSPEGFFDDDDCLLLFKGDLQIKGDLDDKWYKNILVGKTWENKLYGIVVNGNLKVDGDITIDMPVLQILGDLTCDYLYSGDGHTVILGEANIKYGVYGNYNDGSLDIEGGLVTPYIIAGDHAMPRESTEGEFIYIEGGDGYDDISIGESTGRTSGWGWHYFKDSSRLISKDVWDDRYEFSVKQFFDLVKQGQNPFKELK